MGAGSSSGKSTAGGTSKAEVIKAFEVSEEDYNEALRDLDTDGTLAAGWTESSVDPEAAGNRVLPNPNSLFDGIDVDPRIDTVTAEEAIETISLSYCGTASTPADDMLSWVLGPRWVAFDSPERKDMCKFYGKYGVASCSMKGNIVGLRDPATSEVMAVMLLRRSPESDFEVLRTALKVGSPPHMKKKVYGKEPLRREAAVVKGMKKLSHKGAQYILYNLAVKPAYQGQGCGTALVRALIALGGREGVPIHLDASERLQAFYSRLGFEKQMEEEVADPTGQEGSGSLVLTSMKYAS